jgi:uridine phosphorylase
MAVETETARRGLSAAETGRIGRLEKLNDIKLPGYVLVPGDPDRVSLMAAQWDSAQEYQLPRGFRAAVGVYKGVEIAAYSSMMGAPSMELTINDLAVLGAHTLIRVGTCGAIQESIRNGELIVNEASVRTDGTTHLYVRNEYPAAAAFEVTMALVEASERLGYVYHVGVGATAGSFFAGQGRVSFGGYKPSMVDDLLPDMQKAKVLNFEMEAAALLTLCRLFGLRAGVVCSVVANRVTGEWADAGGTERACRAGAEAVWLLTQWDRLKKTAGKKYITPGLAAGAETGESHG